MLDAEAEPVAEGHLRDSRRQSVRVQCIGGQNPSCFYIPEELLILHFGLFEIGEVVFISVDLYDHQLAAGFLQFRRQDIPCLVPEGFLPHPSSL